MKRIAIFSIHPSYDYRIERHIKSLLSLGYSVDYHNISRESNVQFNVSHQKMNYIHYEVKGKSVFNLFKIYINLMKKINNLGYDYYFIQDPILLSLFIFTKHKKKIVLDVHEIYNLISIKERLLIKFFYNKVNDVIVSAYKDNFLMFNQKKEFIFGNYPLKRDFSYNQVDKIRKFKIIYAGMITEEFRNMKKTLDVFEVLLNSGNFEVHLIGKVANRELKEVLEDKIKYLSSSYDDFYYYGPKSHDFVVEKILECDFSINLISLNNDVSISPNKNYEYMLGNTILVTDHNNINHKLPENIICICDKNDNEKDIAHKIINITKDLNSMNELKDLSRKYILDNNLIWERYIEDYKEIFR
ncbi:glycosyltransferase family 4 protein [Bacillus marasmi]|uniref:glycosyltransferase family 4 protein n=1 Tax=Bacillus marasmi TaxID=1926279 RepID=UPI0011CA07F8|nr:glycosyltransferase family 4 protein [Bacillus marasmi]